MFKSLTNLALGTLVVLMLPLVSFSQSGGFQLVGSMSNGQGSTMNGPTGVHVSGNYAYIVSPSSSSLVVADISNPLNPVKVSSLVNGAGGAVLTAANDIFVSGGYAYIATTSGLEVVNVTNPASPSHAAYVADGTGGAALKGIRDIFVTGNYAYLTIFSGSPSVNALQVMNISNPLAPVHSGKILNGQGGALLNFPSSVFVSGSYAYVASSVSNALEIINVSTPSAPVHHSSLIHGAGGAVLQGANSVYVDNNKAYVLSGSTLEIVDVINPAVPVHLGSVSTGGSSPISVKVAGNFAYALYSGSFDIRVVNVSNPASPSFVSNFNLSGIYPAGLFLSGNYLYVTFNTTNKMDIIDISAGASLVLKGSLYSDGPSLQGPTSIALSGNYAFVTAVSDKALEVVNISNPASPSHATKLMAGSPGLISTPKSVFTSGAYAYVASGNGSSGWLEILNISSPASPVATGNVALGVDAKDVFVLNNYAYVTTPLSLRIFDITNPSLPVQTGSISNGTGGAVISGPTSLYVSGNYAYITNTNNTFQIIDVTSKTSPAHAATVNNGANGALLTSPYCVQVSANHAYIASAGSNAIEIIDVTIPTAPIHKASMVHAAGGPQLSNVRRLAIQGNFLYAVSDTDMTIVNIANPSIPLHVISKNIPGRALSIRANYAYVADPSSLKIVQIPPLISSFSPSTGAAGTTVTLVGENFDAIAANNSITFGNVPSNVNSASETLLITTVPTGAKNGPIIIRVGQLASKSSTNFFVVPTMSITSPSTGIYGNIIPLTVDAGGSTGTVTYSRVNGTGAATLTGSDLTLTGVGTITVTASITSDINYAAATAQQTVTVTKGTQTIAFPALTAKTMGDMAFTISASSSAGLPVSYTSSNPAVATVSGNTITIVCAGSTVITASQPGDSNYNPAVSVDRTLVVAKGNQTITFNALPGKSYGAMPFLLFATTSSGLSPSFISADPILVSIAGSTASIHGAGTVSITAQQAGNACYNAASEVVNSLVINKAILTVTCGSGTKIFGDANPTFSYSYSGFVNGDLPPFIDVPPVMATAATACSPVNSYPVTGSGAADNNYSFNYVNGNFSITKRNINAQPANASRMYNVPNPPFAINYTGTVCSDASIDTSPVPFTGASQTAIPGNYPILLSGGLDNNYTFTFATGTLTVTKATQTIIFPPQNNRSVGDIFTLNGSASSGLPISYSSANTSIATINGDVATANAIGTTTITAAQPGNTNYLPATDLSRALTVVPFSFQIIGNGSFCQGGTTLLSPNISHQPDFSYYWSDGTTQQVKWVSSPGSYSLTITRNPSGISATSNTISVSQVPIENGGEISVSPLTCFNYQGHVLTLATSPAGASYSWSTGATSPSISVNAAGVYSVSYISAGKLTKGCIDLVNCYYRTKWSADESAMNNAGEASEPSFEYFPNPADNELTLQLPFPPDRVTPFKIYNMMGAVVHESYFRKGEQIQIVDVSGLISGVFLIQVESNGGFVSRKVVVNHRN